MTAELKLQNDTKNKFLSIVSHDSINPIAGIIGFSELLKENSEDLSPYKIKSFASIINKSANFTLALLHDLLEWSRVQISTIEPKLENFILSDLLSHNIAGISSLGSSKNIVLIADFPENLSVFAEKKMVSTITRKLMSNTNKFNPKGGMITISSREMMINDKKMIETTIAVKGIEMSEEKVRNLF